MKAIMILKMVGILYRNGLREILIKLVDDPEKEWDNTAIKVLDELFGWS